MTAIITVIIDLLMSLLPTIESMAPAAIDNVLAQVAKAVPLLEGAAPNIVAAIQAIINALSNNPNKTVDQLTALQALAASAASAWAASVSASQAEDAASPSA
jgi:endonuclease III